ncbi:hypothetical protein Pcinc_008195 [Petrolisthes cinctipes]|uniref:Uncharacterized protein n=1 Tax=Petrolisthes cinctipes TaxID=88211 RepID=A0AAE1KZQ2_PETCI|nr:hypothetical protein Pcinc_008195 [Petrolisthes cinctipes]
MPPQQAHTPVLLRHSNASSDTRVTRQHRTTMCRASNVSSTPLRRTHHCIVSPPSSTLLRTWHRSTHPTQMTPTSLHNQLKSGPYIMPRHQRMTTARHPTSFLLRPRG